MMTIVQDEKVRGLYRVLDSDGGVMYEITLAEREGKGRICRGLRDRYTLEFNWQTQDKYAAMKHMDKLNLPYRITDILGKERGWLLSAPASSITGDILFQFDGYSYQVVYFRDAYTDEITDLTIYLRREASEYGQHAAKVAGLNEQEVTVEAVNDIASETAILIAVYFIFSAYPGRGKSNARQAS